MTENGEPIGWSFGGREQDGRMIFRHLAHKRRRFQDSVDAFLTSKDFQERRRA
jgi:hypothetical protein